MSKSATATRGTAPAKAPKVQPPSPSKPVLREVPPNAAKTLQAIREMGYDSYASVMDLIDNSIDAKATKIAVKIGSAADRVSHIDVLDNGMGMDEPTLAQALRLGSDTKRTVEDLGKYGFGLVSASLSMAKSIWVLTRKDKGTAYEANFDMAVIERENKFVISLHPATNHAKVVEIVGDVGTLVRLSNIDRISDRNVARFAANLREKLGQVYRNFIKAGVQISVNNRIVKAMDPLMRDHPQAEVVFDHDLRFGEGKTAHLTVVELPDLGTEGDQKAGIYPSNSGFYIVRNGRQIMDAQTFGFYQRHHSYSHFRAEIAFDGNSDDLWHVDIKKSTIHPDDKLLDKLREATEKLIAKSGKKSRTSATPQPTLKLARASDLLNQRLAAKAQPPAPEGNGKATPAAPAATKAEAKPDAAQPDAKPAPAEPVAVEHQARVKFVDEEGDPEGRWYSAVEKGGVWLVKMNTRHPLVKTVAEANHAAATALLSYVTFAVAQAEREGGKGADKFLDSVSRNLSDILGA
jgi:hypothetical protein